jgi:hypothetical protein
LELEKLVARYPNVFHMAERGTWPSIRERGLFSASGVLDIFKMAGPPRFAIESEHRPEKIAVGDGAQGIVLRDQKPMEAGRLSKALLGDVTTRQWYETINSKVFFWAEEKRLLGLLNARAYRNLEHDVLTLDTASLLAEYHESTWLCHMNSGNTFPVPHPRDLSAFKRIPDYPTKANGNPEKEVVELVIDYHVPNIAQHVVAVRRMKGAAVLSDIPLQ